MFDPDVHGSLLHLTIGGGFGSRLPSEGARHYLRNGKEIPDELLPGRRLMHMNPEYRERLINTNWQNVAPWWVKIMCG